MSLESGSLRTGCERGTGVSSHGSRRQRAAGGKGTWPRRLLSMGVPPPERWALALLLLLLSRTLCAESHLSLLYHLTAVSKPAPGTPAFWVSGWLGPQQYLSYSNLRAQAEPCGAWVWENQVSWYWEKETADLRIKEKLFLEAFKALDGKVPYTLQGLLGCELGPDNASVPTAKFALNGEEFMSFDLKKGTWNGDWPEAQVISEQWRQQADAASKEMTFLLYSCPQRLLGHLERGRGNLEWKGEEFHDVEDAETYKKMLARDERRFRVADQDGDSMATREELTAFLHPEEFPHMRDIVIAETLEDLDKNRDGYVQVEEYIVDLYSEEPGEEEPAWVQTERQQFRDFRDLNKDGRLDGKEVGHWVLPPSQDQPLVEANHLLQESDTDKDGRLSKAEILGNWNMFVGSQATNYGEDLTRHHDEL